MTAQAECMAHGLLSLILASTINKILTRFDSSNVKLDISLFLNHLKINIKTYKNVFGRPAKADVIDNKDRLMEFIANSGFKEFIQINGDTVHINADTEEYAGQMKQIVMASSKTYSQFLFKNVNDLAKVYNSLKTMKEEAIKNKSTTEQEQKDEVMEEEENEEETNKGKEDEKEEDKEEAGDKMDIDNENDKDENEDEQDQEGKEEDKEEISNDDKNNDDEQSNYESNELNEEIQEKPTIEGSKETIDEKEEKETSQIEERPRRTRGKPLSKDSEKKQSVKEVKEEVKVEKKSKNLRNKDQHDPEDDNENQVDNNKEDKNDNNEGSESDADHDDVKGTKEESEGEKEDDGNKTPRRSTRKRSASPASTPGQNYKKFQTVGINLINNIQSHRFSSVFLQPVNKKEIPDYYDVVYHPKDLKTLMKNVKTKQGEPIYHEFEDLERDILLMFANCIVFNHSDEDLVKLARTMKDDVVNNFKIFREAAQQ